MGKQHVPVAEHEGLLSGLRIPLSDLVTATHIRYRDIHAVFVRELTVQAAESVPAWGLRRSL